MRLLIFLLLFSSLAFSQKDEETKIFYADRSELTWDDFKANPKDQVNTVEQILGNISYSTSLSQDGLILSTKVYAFMYPLHSFKSTTGLAELDLAHRQMHFDIIEWHARVLNYKFSKYKPTKDFKKDLFDIYNQVMNDHNHIQLGFNQDTEDLGIVEANKRWQSYVDEKLELYKDYASTSPTKKPN